MRKVLAFSLLLVLGLVGSQTLPGWLGQWYGSVGHALERLTLVALSFIMIHVGYEFEIDKRNPRQYAWDYFVAATAAAFPWVFCCFYFIFMMENLDAWRSWEVWKEAGLASRFASPTSAGVLFSMLAAGGLSATWVYRKAKVLAIFDDLDTVLLMIPLNMAMMGFRWQLSVSVFVMVALVWAAWRWLHVVRLPVGWRWVLSYSVGIVTVCEGIAHASRLIDGEVPVHIEVLLPAFVLGCLLAPPAGQDPHSDDTIEGHLEGPVSPEEQRASTIVTAVFMVLVGLSMPVFIGVDPSAPPVEQSQHIAGALIAHTPEMSWPEIAWHTAVVTVLCNLGKMFPAFCYRKQASLRDRLALSIGMWPRGEVGAGVLVLSISYGIGGPVMIVAMLSLTVNLLLTGVFILMIKWMLTGKISLRVTERVAASKR